MASSGRRRGRPTRGYATGCSGGREGAADRTARWAGAVDRRARSAAGQILTVAHGGGVYDLAIYDATLVTPRGRRRAHLYAENGRIVGIGGERLAARQTIDAAGLHLLPGAVDGHVHFQDPGDTSREDFTS